MIAEAEPLTATEAPQRPRFDSLSAVERAALMREVWQRKSRFQQDFGTDAVDLSCGPFTESWRDQVMRILRGKGAVSESATLEGLHEILSSDMKECNPNDGVNLISTLLYDTDDEFAEHYHAFIRDCIRPLFPYPFYFQATPTIRIHCPGSKHNDHFPRYHTDIGYGHPPEEINLWIPLTAPVAPQMHGFRCADVRASNEILERFGFDFGPFIERAVEEKPFNVSLNEFSPQVSTPRGQMHAFDSRCIHTGEPLIAHTRASIDIRILPVADYRAMPVEYQGVGRRRVRYVPGQAYNNLTSTEL